MSNWLARTFGIFGVLFIFPVATLLIGGFVYKNLPSSISGPLGLFILVAGAWISITAALAIIHAPENSR